MVAKSKKAAGKAKKPAKAKRAPKAKKPAPRGGKTSKSATRGGPRLRKPKGGGGQVSLRAIKFTDNSNANPPLSSDGNYTLVLGSAESEFLSMMTSVSPPYPHAYGFDVSQQTAPMPPGSFPVKCGRGDFTVSGVGAIPTTNWPPPSGQAYVYITLSGTSPKDASLEVVVTAWTPSSS